jgi:hypothetical protein
VFRDNGLRDGSRRHRVKITWKAIFVAVVISWLTYGVAIGQEFEFSYKSRDLVTKALPPIPSTGVQLVLDDDQSDGDFGVNAPNAQQFMWFNQFTPPTVGVRLDEIWVLFPPSASANVSVGDQIEILVYRDPDGNPSNGATLLQSISETVQIADGNTFSLFTLASPIVVTQPGDILIGVVDRWVTSGVTGPTRPAAIDVTASQGRSWLAVWSSDPPPSPTLPADSVFSLIDAFQPGNWMIRAFGEPLVLSSIPTVSHVGLAAFLLLLGMSGVLLLRRI